MSKLQPSKITVQQKSFNPVGCQLLNKAKRLNKCHSPSMPTRDPHHSKTLIAFIIISFSFLSHWWVWIEGVCPVSQGFCCVVRGAASILHGPRCAEVCVQDAGDWIDRREHDHHWDGLGTITLSAIKINGCTLMPLTVVTASAVFGSVFPMLVIHSVLINFPSGRLQSIVLLFLPDTHELPLVWEEPKGGDCCSGFFYHPFQFSKVWTPLWSGNTFYTF